MINNNGNGNNNGLDLAGLLLNLYSVVLGMQNLQLNNEQVNALDSHLMKQDNEFLAKIIEQNSLQIEQNREILSTLNKILNKIEKDS